MCVCKCTMSMQCLGGLEEDFGSPGTGVSGGSKLPCGLEEQHITAEPSL